MTIGNSIGFNRARSRRPAPARSSARRAKLRESLSARDYGASGDGVTDDTAAMLTFFTACIAGRAIPAPFPPALI